MWTICCILDSENIQICLTINDGKTADKIRRQFAKDGFRILSFTRIGDLKND